MIRTRGAGPAKILVIGYYNTICGIEINEQNNNMETKTFFYSLQHLPQYRGKLIGLWEDEEVSLELKLHAACKVTILYYYR